MKAKSTVIIENDKNKKKIEYPILMKSESSTLIVLFRSERNGVVVDESKHPLGTMYTNSNMHDFSPLKGKVILKNKEN